MTEFISLFRYLQQCPVLDQAEENLKQIDFGLRSFETKRNNGCSLKSSEQIQLIRDVFLFFVQVQNKINQMK